MSEGVHRSWRGKAWWQRRPAWILLLVPLLSAGCSDKDKVPRGILPQDQMVQLVWDLAEADQYGALYIAKDSGKSDAKLETMRLYETVFRLHHVTKEEFTRSYRYYLDHPELNQLLFDSVTTRGTRARSEMLDRPFYRAPAPVLTPHPGGPGNPGGGATGKVGTPQGTPLKPGQNLPVAAFLPGTGRPVTPDMMRRMREENMRRMRDSMARRVHGARDTAPPRP